MQIFTTPDTIPVPDFTEFFNNGAYDLEAEEAANNRYLNALRDFIKQNYGEHPLAGKVIRKPFADGAAEYMVTPYGRSIALIHLELGDAWSDEQFERTVTVAEVKRMVERQAKLEKWFASSD